MTIYHTFREAAAVQSRELAKRHVFTAPIVTHPGGGWRVYCEARDGKGSVSTYYA